MSFHESHFIQGKRGLLILICSLMLVMIFLTIRLDDVNAQVGEGIASENAVEIVETDHSIQTRSAGYAWGDPDGDHLTYAWPFEVVQMGHAIQSYQNYGGSPYFHHGMDMIAPEGTDVYTRSGGQVINIENYNPGWHLYWEVAVLDAEGYVWQYHHIDEPTIPQVIFDAYDEWLADPFNGGFVSVNTYIGDIVPWPVFSFGYYFNHIHLNILADGDVYLNPMEFHTPLADAQAPEIQEIGLLNGDVIVSGNIVTGNYGLYVKARDLLLSDVYYLPPYKVEFSIDNNEWVTVWEFHDLPGADSDTAFIHDYFVPNYTCGNYECREFYMDLGFTPLGQRIFPGELGEHIIQVRVADFYGNESNESFSWIVAKNLPDNGCVSGQGVQVSFAIMDDLVVTDLNLGINLSHNSRGQVIVSVRSPEDTNETIIIDASNDTYNNFDVWLDDSSEHPLNDGDNDMVSAPYFDRTSSPGIEGSLESFNGKNALGIWTISICDSTAGISGSINLVDFEVIGMPHGHFLFLPFIRR